MHEISGTPNLLVAVKFHYVTSYLTLNLCLFSTEIASEKVFVRNVGVPRVLMTLVTYQIGEELETNWAEIRFAGWLYNSCYCTVHIASGLFRTLMRLRKTFYFHRQRFLPNFFYHRFNFKFDINNIRWKLDLHSCIWFCILFSLHFCFQIIIPKTVNPWFRRRSEWAFNVVHSFEKLSWDVCSEMFVRFKTTLAKPVSLKQVLETSIAYDSRIVLALDHLWKIT